MATFATSEIVELGIQIERNGKDFYSALARMSKDEKARSVFEFLAGEEEKHISVFQVILDSVKRYEPKESYPAEYFAYMKALAGDYVFTKAGKGEEKAKEAKSELEAIDIGVVFEKDSIVFYGGMRRLIPLREHHIIDVLIKQEQDHLRRLVDLSKSFA